jgi:hypothetical protein
MNNLDDVRTGKAMNSHNIVNPNKLRRAQSRQLQGAQGIVGIAGQFHRLLPWCDKKLYIKYCFLQCVGVNIFKIYNV